ncbi:MAG: hypothetical protein M1481_01770 [Candidatus Thermoplasmatota archaeon]|jgi:hypothetical protein|nr:hypothetical protein [Candidatus Thermoplasmatota archaeon]MCL5962890.1 hypothetical protein [Candidatus Thermoplasmatota archaeon]
MNNKEIFEGIKRLSLFILLLQIAVIPIISYAYINAVYELFGFGLGIEFILVGEIIMIYSYYTGGLYNV